jgi:transposase-like protein
LWGFTEDGERVLLAVSLGMRESFEDWQTLGRDLISRGLGAPMLIVADGAPGLIKAIEQCRPASDRRRCCVHRARNLYAKLPEREREPVKQAYRQALDDAIGERDAKQRLQALVDDLHTAGFTAAAHCLADDLDAPVVHLRYPVGHRRRWKVKEPARALAWRGQATHEGDGPLPRRDQLPHPRLGRPGTSSSPTRPTASALTNSTTNASSERDTPATSTPVPRR